MQRLDPTMGTAVACIQLVASLIHVGSGICALMLIKQLTEVLDARRAEIADARAGMPMPPAQPW